MNQDGQHASFTGSIPALYDQDLGPVIFAPYADHLTALVAARVRAGTLLELACGTGQLTRRLDAVLPPTVAIVATDLNEGMLAHATSAVPASGRVVWRIADAGALPFAAQSFDAIACQFGLMFVPDKAAPFREARRVLRPGGHFLFNVWTRMDENPFARIAHTTIARFFTGDAPTFYQVPFGFHDAEVIGGYLRESGFTDIRFDKVTFETRAESARRFAVGLVEGNPVSFAIRDAGIPFEAVVGAVTDALIAEGGDAPFRSSMCALVCTAKLGVNGPS